VGLCKSCSKGICPECAIDVGGGLACKETCIEAVQSLNALISGNTSKVAQRLRASYFWPAFLMVLGILFIAAPIISGKPPMAYSTISGLAFTGFGVLLAAYQRAFNKAYRRSAQSGSQGGRPPRPPHHLACGSALGGSGRMVK